MGRTMQTSKPIRSPKGKRIYRKKKVRIIESLLDQDDIGEAPLFSLDNPLMNAVILTLVLQYCSVKELVNLRIVCKLWYKLSLKRLRDKVVVNIQNDSDNTCDSRSSEDAMVFPDLPHFTSFVDESNSTMHISLLMKPYRNFVLHDYSLQSAHQQDAIANFFTIYGSWMTHLELRNLHVDETSLDTYFSIILLQTPNLKSLNTSLGSINWEGDEPTLLFEDSNLPQQNKLRILKLKGLCVSTVWRYLLQHFPFIEDFSPLDISLSDLLEVMNTIKSAKRVDNRKYNLKHLDLRKVNIDNNNNNPDEAAARKIVAIFSDIQAPLESLKVHSNTLIWKENTDTLLKMHHKTLKQIYIGSKSNCRTDFPYQVCFETLEKLKFTKSYPTSISFFSYLPNLRVLHLKGSQGLYFLKHTKLKEMKNVVVPSIQNFTFEIIPNEKRQAAGITLPRFRSLCMMMPNITVLKMPLSNETFREVCRSWTNLVELSVFDDGYGVDDEGITGITKGKRWKKMSQSAIDKRLPNITNLKHLRSFALNNCKTRLTNKSVERGFSKLPYLTSLSINAIKIGPDEVKNLMEKVPRAKLGTLESLCSSECDCDSSFM